MALFPRITMGVSATANHDLTFTKSVMRESLDISVRSSLLCNIVVFSNLSSVLFILVSGIMLSFRFGVLKVT